MMKMMKGKKGRTASKLDYDLREKKTENIFTVNFDLKQAKNISEAKQIIVENIKTETKRKDGNEYISFVISPPVSRVLVEAYVESDTKKIKFERAKMKAKTISLAVEFLSQNFSDVKACIVAHENQSLPHCHILLSSKNIDEEQVRINSLKELQQNYQKLLRKNFKEELDFLEERKENDEVLTAEFDRKKYVFEKKNEKKESFVELISKIKNKKIEIEKANEEIQKYKKDFFEKDVLFEEMHYHHYNEIDDDSSNSDEF